MASRPGGRRSLSGFASLIPSGLACIGVSSFGGAQPWARRELVERRAWLTSKEFAEAIGVGQLLPGPNVVNLSVMVGRRFPGACGALLAFSGLMLGPLIIILSLAALHDGFGRLSIVRQVFGGVAAGTAGLIAATGIKMLLR